MPECLPLSPAAQKVLTAAFIYQPTPASTPIQLPRWIWIPARSGSLPGYWAPCAYTR
jgi:hypothetical protein